MRTSAAIAVFAALALAGCGEQGAAPAAQADAAVISEADAATAADATQLAWASKDVAKIDALYAPDVVGFDPMVAPLSTDRGNWTKLQQGFADMKFDDIKVAERKIQVLDADTFVVSGTAAMTSKDGPMKTATMRFTDVYQRDADGKWWIVNEHVSLPPEAAPAA